MGSGIFLFVPSNMDISCGLKDLGQGKRNVFLDAYIMS